MIPEPTKEGWATLLKIIAEFLGRWNFGGQGQKECYIEDGWRGLKFYLNYCSDLDAIDKLACMDSESCDCYLVPQGKSPIYFYTCWPLWYYFCHYSIPRLMREQEERERERKEDRAAEMQDVVSEVKQWKEEEDDA